MFPPTFNPPDRLTAPVLPRTLALIVLLGVWCAAGVARAADLPQMSTRFKINHVDPEASVPGVAERNASPVEFGYYLQDLAAFAAKARRAGTHALEARYYLAFAKAVPDRATGFGRACEALENARQLEQALEACRTALELEGVELRDYVRFVRLILAKPAPLPAPEKDAMMRAIVHLRSDAQSRTAGLHLQCEAALHEQDFASLADCAHALERVAPNDTKTITFLWALASHEGNRRDAEILIERARSHGVSAAVIARMDNATRALGWRRFVPSHGVAWMTGLVAGAAALAVAGLALAARRLRRGRHQSVANARS